jgi:hypothetical protein
MKRLVALGVSIFITAVISTPAGAALRYSRDQTNAGIRYIVVEGEFAFDDDLNGFSATVASHNPAAVIFNSPGGNVSKAMELGRMIRTLGLSTLQARALDCASACALAFLGGVSRYAEPGALGVHRASFNAGSGLSVDDAVSEVQKLTAEVIEYMIEMGVDPALLRLSLKYDTDDIRYLSKSEMQQYRVVTADAAQESVQAGSIPPAPQPQIVAAPSLPNTNASSLALPDPRSGRVRHPKGQAPLKSSPDGKSANLANLANGTTLSIAGSVDRWYQVNAIGQTGYMHHSWVFVDQYDSGPFGQRHIQVKSFDNLAEATAYARSSAVPLATYLATNGWFAVTLAETFDQDVARRLIENLKAQHSIPDDAFVVYGNTYVRRVCCH